MKTSKPTPVVDNAANGPESLLERLCPWMKDPLLRRIQPKGMPHLYGKEDLEMGESTIHTITAGILLYGLSFHFAALTGYRVFGNLNLYYLGEDPTDYVSPDVMVVRPQRPLPVQLLSYRIGEHGPAPVMVGEVLSFRTWQQGDLARKPMIYSDIGVEEYILADVTGEMLEQRLLLLRRQRKGGWRDEQDADGGITSRLGFRILLEGDGQLRVIDAKTGKRYARPEEAQAMADKASALEEELARLRGTLPKEQERKGRRRKP
jgi:Uma2 family endonuclease